MKPPVVSGYREREQGRFYPLVNTDVWTKNGTFLQTADYPQPDRRGEKTWMVDFVTPGYKKKSVLGGIVNTPMWRTSIVRTCDGVGPRMINRSYPPDVYEVDLRGAGRAKPISVNSFPAASSLPAYDHLYAQVRTRAYANIDKPDYQSQIFLGEFRETMSYLRNPFKTGLKLADTLNGRLRRAGIFNKSVALKNSSKIRKDVASAYLAVQYGFKPLVKDVVSILENLRPRASDQPKRETARAKEERGFTKTWTAYEEAGGLKYDAKYTYTRFVTVKAGILYENIDAFTDKDKWGLRPKDIPLSVWQLAPLSFVVDWFVNVGDFVSAITPSAGTKTLCMWTTTIVEETLTREASNFRHIVDSWVTSGGRATDTIKRTTYHRDPSIFAPSLAFKKDNAVFNDADKTLSLLAILTGRLTTLEPYDPAVSKRSVSKRRWSLDRDFF